MSVAPSHVGENVAGAGRGCRPDNGTGGFYSAEIRPKLESRSLVGVQQDDVVITAGSVLETRIPVARSCRSATSAIAYYALLAVRCWEVLAAVTVKQYSLFVRNCFHREGEGHPPDRNLAATVSGGLHASRDSFYRTARAERQYRPGVISTRADPAGPPAAAMSGLSKRDDHRPWVPTPPEPRQPTRIDLRAPWSLSALWEDLYGLARVARAVGTLHLELCRGGIR